MTAPETNATRTATRDRFSVTPATYRKLTIAALCAVAVVVITGTAVRLTGSGLGCDTWPNCSDQSLIQFGSPNQAIEQGNRLFSGVVGIGAGALVVFGALRRTPYRRDLVWWSAGVLGCVLGQVPLGGITVLVHLHPAAVGAHFVLSMLAMVFATGLVWRASHDPGPFHPVVGRVELALSGVAVFTAAALMVTGPLVTGSGPHAGDAAARRFGFFIPDVARVHSINMWIFLVVIVVLLVRMARDGAPAAVQRRGRRLLTMIVVQGAIGYAQYELGIPAWLVLLHVAGATAIVGLTVWFRLGLSAPARRPVPVEAVT